jgi:integrase
VNQQVNRVGNRYYDGKTSKLIFAEPKSRNSHRTIPLPPFVIEALQRHKRTSPDLIFSTRKGTAVEPRRYDKLFKQILQKADLPQEIRLHSARHFGLSLLAALGVHPRVAMEIAGHSDLRTTMMIYSHIASPEMKEAMDRIQEVFGTTQ